jgi:hypothetical protein
MPVERDLRDGADEKSHWKNRKSARVSGMSVCQLMRHKPVATVPENVCPSLQLNIRANQMAKHAITT